MDIFFSPASLVFWSWIVGRFITISGTTLERIRLCDDYGGFPHQPARNMDYAGSEGGGRMGSTHGNGINHHDSIDVAHFYPSDLPSSVQDNDKNQISRTMRCGRSIMKCLLSCCTLLVMSFSGAAICAEPIPCTLDTLSQHCLSIQAQHEPDPPNSSSNLLIEFRISSKDILADELTVWLDTYDHDHLTLSVQLSTARIDYEGSYETCSYFTASRTLLKNLKLRFRHRRGADPNTYLLPAELVLSAPLIK